MPAYILLKEYIKNYQDLNRNAWEGIFFTFIQALANGMIFFLSLYFVDVLSIKVAAVGIMLAAYRIGTIIGGFLSGYLVTKISIKLISIFSLAIQSINYFLLMQLKSVEFITINLFIMGIFTFSFFTVNDIWMLNNCKNLSERLKIVNISHVALNFGFGLAGVIIGLITLKQFNFLFLFFGILLLLCSCYLFFQKNYSKNTLATGNKAEELLFISADQRIFFMVLVCLFFVGMMIAQLSTTYPLYLQELFPQMGLKAVSILYILDTILIIFFQPFLINLLSKFNKVIVVGVGAFCMGFGMLILSVSDFFSMAILSCIIWTIGEMLFMPMARLVCYEYSPPTKKAQNIGIFKGMYAFSIISGSTLGGIVYQEYGGQILWYICGIVGIFCLIMCSSFKLYSFAVANTNTSS